MMDLDFGNGNRKKEMSRITHSLATKNEVLLEIRKTGGRLAQFSWSTSFSQ